MGQPEEELRLCEGAVSRSAVADCGLVQELVCMEKCAQGVPSAADSSVPRPPGVHLVGPGSVGAGGHLGGPLGVLMQVVGLLWGGCCSQECAAGAGFWLWLVLFGICTAGRCAGQPWAMHVVLMDGVGGQCGGTAFT